MELREAFIKRYATLTRRSQVWRASLPDREQLWLKLLWAYKNGFNCYYCDRPLQVREASPSPSVFSFDHYDSSLLGEWFSQIWRSKMADKLERLNEESEERR